MTSPTSPPSSLRFAALLFAVAACACGGAPARYHWTPVYASRDTGPCINAAVDADGTAILLCGQGFFRYDGKIFAATDTGFQNAGGCPFRVGSDGAWYSCTERLARGAHTSENLDPTGVLARGVTPIAATTGDLYAWSTPPTGPRLMHRGPSETTWTPLGPDPFPQSEAVFADAKGNVWLEVKERLYRATGATLTYVLPSKGLSEVEPAGTFLYWPGVKDSLTASPNYGEIIRRTVDDVESVLTDGLTCKATSDEKCPQRYSDTIAGDIKNTQRAPSGSIYYTWVAGNGDSGTIMRLSPGSHVWEPVWNDFDAWTASSGHVQILVDGREQIWATTNNQVGGIGHDGSVLNAMFTSLWRLDPD